MASGDSLEKTFKKFATKAGGGEATSKDITRWFKDAGCFGKTCTSNSLDIAFSAVKTKGKPNITASQMKDLCKKMAGSYKTDHKLADNDAAEAQLIEKLTAAEPKTHGTTKQSKTGGVDKMTDTKQYTGSHAQRFDESGKGKGAAGRKDEVNTSGYVGNYKGDGTYDKKK